MPTDKFHLIEAEYGKSMEEILVELYQKFGNQREVAEALNVSKSSISWWLTRCRLRQVTRLEPIREELSHERV
ncbi:MAG: hypothetical protein KJ064_27820 [Anaerolineae bacterium]|nr:hypothetical protein [Anaerolineae bacterium]